MEKLFKLQPVCHICSKFMANPHYIIIGDNYAYPVHHRCFFKKKVAARCGGTMTELCICGHLHLAANLIGEYSHKGQCTYPYCKCRKYSPKRLAAQQAFITSEDNSSVQGGAERILIARRLQEAKAGKTLTTEELRMKLKYSPKRPEVVKSSSETAQNQPKSLIGRQDVQGGAERCPGCDRIMLHMKQKSTGSCMMICPVSAKRPYIESLGYEEEK